MKRYVLSEIEKDNNLFLYFLDNSYVFKDLNRNSGYIKDFLDSYKKNKRDKSLNKFNDYLNNIELLSTLIKMK